MRSYLDKLNEMMNVYDEDKTIYADAFGIIQPDGSICKIGLPRYIRVYNDGLISTCERSMNKCQHAYIHEDSQVEGNINTTYSQLKILLNKEDTDQLNKLVYLKDNKWNNLGNLMTKCNLLGNTHREDEDCLYPIIVSDNKVSEDRDHMLFMGVGKHSLSDRSFYIIIYAYGVDKKK
jgi:hypothetical protein